MTISGISNNLQAYQNTNSQQNASVQNNWQQFQQEFQQLGVDLQSGNLSAAQTDLTTLQQTAGPGLSSTSNPNNPIGQSFSQLSEQLQAGNLSGAQQDYSNIQQDFQNHFQNQGVHLHHHHHHGAIGTPSTPVDNPLQQLGLDLQSSSAQQAYSSWQLNLAQPLGVGSSVSDPTQTATSGISLMV